MNDQKPERKVLEGTIVGINNKVSIKGQSYTVYKVVTLDEAELNLYKWESNLDLLNKIVRFEVESTVKGDKQYDTIAKMEVVQK